MNEPRIPQVEQFFKDAFAIDGKATVLQPDEARKLLLTNHRNIDVIQLEDSKRGTFYVATFHTQ